MPTKKVTSIVENSHLQPLLPPLLQDLQQTR